MERQVFLFDIDQQEALGFDTGLDSRAFARAKFSQFTTEPGFIVSLDGSNSSVNFWKASGVVENSTMAVWGPPFKGERLDLLLQDNDKRDEALAAIRLWIQAVLALGEKHQAPLWPCAALVGDRSNAVFFAPLDLALHCLMAKESNKINKCYVHPDFDGINAAAFTAAAMLYRVFSGSLAFPAIMEEIILHEDMREGNFLPIGLAAPGLDNKLSTLIQNALSQNAKKGGPADGARLLGELLATLRADSPDSFFNRLSEADTLQIEKEKTQYQKAKTASVNMRRFVKRNAAILIGSFAAIVIAVLIANSIIKSRSLLSTANMEPVHVIESYYNAFGKLDHQWMEACVIKGAGKDDIDMVTGIFLVSKIRQAYELNTRPLFMSAKDWLEAGGEQTDLLVFGVTDLQITDADKVGESNEAQFRVDYTLWVPEEEGPAPMSLSRTDFVTLVQKKGRWRISEIKRTRL